MGTPTKGEEARSAEEGELGADGKGQEPEQYRQGGGRRMRETELLMGSLTAIQTALNVVKVTTGLCSKPSLEFV